jgi:predicted  nucleic acid-binding Zn-ribbon protein
VPVDDVESAHRGPIRGGIEVPNLDDRVTKLEERSDAHTRTMDYLRAEMSDLRGEMHALAGELRTEMSDLRSEMHALASELRGEMHALRTEMRHDFADMRATMDRRFTWLTGILVAGLVGVIGALVGTR